MAAEHEKGPWKITSMSGGCARVGTDTSHTIAVVGGVGQESATANASRIVMCVNACEGLSIFELRQIARIVRNRRKSDEHNFSCRGTRVLRTEG